MKFVKVLVEGPTEDEFIRDIVNEYLQPKQIYLDTIIAKTKRPIGSDASYKGGIVSFGKVKFDIEQLLFDRSASLVTTMIDFYRIPTDFPGYNDPAAKSGSVQSRTAHLEQKLAETINHPRFFPYLSTHEFEALLFCDPAAIVKNVRGNDVALEATFEDILANYSNPEEINTENPPSKRIVEHLKEYDKRVHGNLIAIEIGVQMMRDQCPHFNTWLEKIESLTPS